MRVVDGILLKRGFVFGRHRLHLKRSTFPSVRMRLVLLCVCAALVLCATPAVASAAPTGSITLNCSVERDGVDMPLVGDRYAAVLVARASIDGDGVHYKVLDAFASADCAWAELDAAGLRDKAREVHDLALDAAVNAADTLSTNASGIGSVYGLEPGVYLLYRTEAAPANADTTVDPFLVSVPTLVNGVLAYEVTAYPKFGFGDDEPDAPESGKPGQGDFVPWLDLPTTGDLQMIVVGVLVLAGGAMFALARRITR